MTVFDNIGGSCNKSTSGAVGLGGTNSVTGGSSLRLLVITLGLTYLDDDKLVVLARRWNETTIFK
jgi:hypothetical protein